MEILIKQLIAALGSLTLLLTQVSATIPARPARGFVLGPGIGASDSLILGAATGSGLFPTSTLNNFQDGDTIQSADWNGLERKMGINNSTDTASLDWQLRATTSSNPGHVHTSSSLTSYGVFATATVSSTLIVEATTTARGSIVDSAGNRYTTSSIPIQWTIENPTATEDDYLFTARTTTTINRVYAVNKTTGDTATFNLVASSSRSAATSTIHSLFTAYQAVTATTTASCFAATTTTVCSTGTFGATASTSVTTGETVRFITTAASSSQLGLTIWITEL